MIIYAKIGTHSQRKLRIGWKRKEPKVGDILRYKSIPAIPGEKWRMARVEEIKNLGYPLHYLSLY